MLLQINSPALHAVVLEQNRALSQLYFVFITTKTLPILLQSSIA